MASINLEVLMPRRRAKARLHQVVAKYLGLSFDEYMEYSLYDCFVLHTSQEQDEDGCVPVFVCEFHNGRVYNVPTESITFVDTDEKGEYLCS